MDLGWVVIMVAVAAVVLLAPFLRHLISDSDEQGPAEQALDWLDSVRQTISGLWPR